MTSRRPFLLLRICFPGGTIFIQFVPSRPRRTSCSSCSQWTGTAPRRCGPRGRRGSESARICRKKEIGGRSYFLFDFFALLVRPVKSEWREHLLGALLACNKSQHCLSVRLVGIAFPPVQCWNTGLKKKKQDVWNFYTTQQCTRVFLSSLRLNRPAPCLWSCFYSKYTDNKTIAK